MAEGVSTPSCCVSRRTSSSGLDVRIQILGLTFVVSGAGPATLLLPDYPGEAVVIWDGDIRTFPAI